MMSPEFRPMLRMVKDWRQFLVQSTDDEDIERIRSHERTGRPLGDDEWVEELEALLDRRLRPQKRGPKPKSKSGKRASES